MVRLSQNVNAFYEAEATRGTEVATTLKYLGLLDTFDARNLDMQYAPVPTIGQSTDPQIVKGPEMVKLAMKFGLWGTGWRDMLGWAIGKETINSVVSAHNLNETTPHAFTVMAEEIDGTNYQTTLVNGVTINSLTLEADYTTGGPLTMEMDCNALYSFDEDANSNRTTARNISGGFIAANYSGVALPSAPATAPLTATDLAITYDTGVTTPKGLTISASPAGSYVEVGERWMQFRLSDGTLDTSLASDGIIDFTAGAENTITEVQGLITADANWTCAVLGGGGALDSKNLLKGIYSGNNVSRAINVAENMTALPYVKTAKLTINNNHQTIPERVTGADSAVKTLQNANIAAGKADVTLDLTLTGKDETFYALMYADTTIPLMRLAINDNGTTRTIGLTNGKIMTRTAPYTAGGEVVETISIKFTGAGDYGNFSSFAISADILPT